MQSRSEHDWPFVPKIKTSFPSPPTQQGATTAVECMAALGPVAEVWMLVPQGFLLLLCQPLEPVVPLAGGFRLVFVHAVKDAEDAEDDSSDLAAQVDGMSDGVSGGVGIRVGPSTRG